MRAYRYRAKGRAEALVSGMVLARSRDVAIQSLRNNGLEPLNLRLSVNYSLEAWRSREFPAAELALFYETLAAQFESGVLEQLVRNSIEFIHDKLLASALETLAIRLAYHGGTLGQEMAQCGFPRSHSEAIHSAAEAGRLQEVLRSLSADCYRNAELGDELRSSLMVPALAMVGIVVGIWASLCFFAPMMRRLWLSLSSLEKRDPTELLMRYMSFVDWVANHRTLFSVCYFIVCALALGVLLSPPVRRLLLRVPIVARLRERSEMLRQWSLWRAFYECGGSPAVASRKLIANCEVEASRRSFEELARLLEQGYAVPEAVRIARFPTYIQSGVAAAFRRNDGVVAGLNAMVKRLAHEVGILVRQVKEIIRTVAPLTLGGGVVLLFAATLLPNLAMIGSVLKHGVGQ